ASPELAAAPRRSSPSHRDRPREADGMSADSGDDFPETAGREVRADRAWTVRRSRRIRSPRRPARRDRRAETHAAALLRTRTLLQRADALPAIVGALHRGFISRRPASLSHQKVLVESGGARDHRLGAVPRVHPLRPARAVPFRDLRSVKIPDDDARKLVDA